MKRSNPGKDDFLAQLGKALLSPLKQTAESIGGFIDTVDSKLDQRFAGKKPPVRRAAPRRSPSQKTAPTPKKAPVPQAPAVLSEEAQKHRLLQQAEDAIHRAFYAEGGFRFFAEKLCRYVQLILPGQTDPETMCVSAYNSCIDPYTHQYRKLEEKLAELQRQLGDEPLAPANAPLYRQMGRFVLWAQSEKLFTAEGWEPEAYKAALTVYGAELQQLLSSYPPSE